MNVDTDGLMGQMQCWADLCGLVPYAHNHLNAALKSIPREKAFTRKYNFEKEQAYFELVDEEELVEDSAPLGHTLHMDHWQYNREC
ncbi:hypothetical protein M0R45_011798 [Rubus argutus]|uniref:Uncharacterized protein n=1 Tax=Rubus argutus TaxID=59490 RepID=A0AAW1YB62_RUBAR